MDEKRNILLIIIAFPIFLQIITYYGFQSAYDSYNTWPDDFRYRSGIYGYRILSNEGVNTIFYLLQKLMQQDFPFKDYLAKKGSTYYHALFIFNSIFAVGSSVTSYGILKSKTWFPGLSVKSMVAIVLALAGLLAISQFVITPYDTMAVFLFLITAAVSFRYIEAYKFKYMLGVSFLILLSTLNRETACLNLSFLAALMIPKFSKNFKDDLKMLWQLWLPVLVFLGTYFILRALKTGQEDTYIFESITLVHNFTGINQILGWLFGILLLILIYFFTPTQANKKMISQFLFFSIPYVVLIFTVGILWEIRLYVPLMYGCVLLGGFRVPHKVISD